MRRKEDLRKCRPSPRLPWNPPSSLPPPALLSLPGLPWLLWDHLVGRGRSGWHPTSRIQFPSSQVLLRGSWSEQRTPSPVYWSEPHLHLLRTDGKHPSLSLMPSESPRHSRREVVNTHNRNSCLTVLAAGCSSTKSEPISCLIGGAFSLYGHVVARAGYPAQVPSSHTLAHRISGHEFGEGEGIRRFKPQPRFAHHTGQGSCTHLLVCCDKHMI